MKTVHKVFAMIRQWNRTRVHQTRIKRVNYDAFASVTENFGLLHFDNDCVQSFFEVTNARSYGAFLLQAFQSRRIKSCNILARNQQRSHSE